MSVEFTLPDASPPGLGNGSSKPALAYADVIRARSRALEDQLQTVLAKPAPIVWEVGCGHGHFLTAYAKANPEQTCIGIDIASDRIERANRKRDRNRLPNLHFIRAEAGLFLATLPDTVRFARVFVLFPDPWPKSRHRKHRLLQAAFLEKLARRAGDGGRFYFRTDFRPYFDDTVELFHSDPHWELADEPWAFEYATVFQERAERHDSLVAKPRAASP